MIPYFTVRGIYESSSLEAAVAAVRRAERAIPANIILTTPQGPAPAGMSSPSTKPQ